MNKRGQLENSDENKLTINNSQNNSDIKNSNPLINKLSISIMLVLIFIIISLLIIISSTFKTPLKSLNESNILDNKSIEKNSKNTSSPKDNISLNLARNPIPF
jgi:hypothetical protein